MKLTHGHTCKVEMS